MQLIDLHQHMVLALSVAALVGACIGSFITLISYRLPRDENVVATRSRCPQCRTPLGARDLIPVLSWLFTHGRCRHCKAKIGARYLVTELLCALGTVLIVYQYGVLSPLTIALLGLWWTSVAIILTDLEHYLIMDEYQIALALFGALYVYALDADITTMLVAVLIGVVGSLVVKYSFLFITKRDGLGLGDVKLFGVVGIWLLEPVQFAPLLVFAGGLGILSAILWRKISKSEVFPFAPAIILSLLLYVFWPDAYATFWQLYGMNMHSPSSHSG